MTDGSGTLLNNKTSHDPFAGRREANWASDITAASLTTLLGNEDERFARGYTDHEQLNRTGFIHMNGRVYDPRIGRFVSADPIVQAPSHSQSYNRYAYVFNNPLSYTDPSGFQSPDPNGDPNLKMPEGLAVAAHTAAELEAMGFDVIRVKGESISMADPRVTIMNTEGFTGVSTAAYGGMPTGYGGTYTTAYGLTAFVFKAPIDACSMDSKCVRMRGDTGYVLALVAERSNSGHFTGHVFAGFIWPSGTAEAWGFYPLYHNPGALYEGSKLEGERLDDTKSFKEALAGNLNSAIQYFVVDETSFKTALTSIRNYRDTNDYGLVTNSCVHAAYWSFNRAGLVPDRPFWPVPSFVYQSIRADQ